MFEGRMYDCPVFSCLYLKTGMKPSADQILLIPPSFKPPQHAPWHFCDIHLPDSAWVASAWFGLLS